MFVPIRRDVRPEDCSFYHSMDLPNYGLVKGAWDLRGKEREYLGGYDFTGASVIEFGPSSGGLTFFIGAECREIVAFEVADEGSVDILPLATRTYDDEVAYARMMTRRFKNAWMLAHTAFTSQARAFYGDIYAIPADIGQYDVAVFASILLHLRDPFRPVQTIASHVTEAIIVTDVVRPGCETETEPVMRLSPGGESSVLYWWDLSPGAVARMLALVGFPRTTINYHRQSLYEMTPLYTARLSDTPSGDIALYTVVGRR